jgi:hypothetical protein
MDFSFSALMAGFVFGVFGLYLLRWGRKTAHTWHMIIGLALMIYPYFVSGPFLIWGTGAGLMLLAYWLR